MLVHICCSVDSHYFLQKLQEEYPDEKLIGFFYDPNIHPYSEYYLRLLDVKRSCKMLDIALIEGEYDVENWLETVRGLEHEPEKGSRCSVCFDRRFEISAIKASELKEELFTSTLLTSPKKSLQQLQNVGEVWAKKYGLTFIAPDYRKASGTQEQNILAKKDALYRQNYCGCMFGLNIQREEQNKLNDELFVPLSKQIQPESIEERVEMYEQRWKLEEQGITHKIIKQRFLNWRLLMGLVRVRKEVIPVHILPYSTLKGEYSRGKIEYAIGEVYHMNRDEVCFVTLAYYNTLAHTSYNTVVDLIYNPPPFKKELEVRKSISTDFYNLSMIIIVEEIPSNKIEILCKSKTYSDVKESLIKL
ncbi:MAG: epoxyqueuosine reductase QueH [Campylobacterota bacterium]|nr:epoxyqueuosine reductase QueH [Campylobacterota bacterium]